MLGPAYPHCLEASFSSPADTTLIVFYLFCVPQIG